MIDSITKLCLSLSVCTNGLSYSGEETRPKLCIKQRQTNLASVISNEINISCYTEYKALGPSLIYNSKTQSGNLQNFLGKFVRLFVTLRCFYGVVIILIENRQIMIFASLFNDICFKKYCTLSLNNLKILRHKVTKNLTNFLKKFCESPPRCFP